MATLRLLDTFSGPATTVGDATPINLGIEFRVDEPCQITAVLWWQAASGGSSATRTVGVYPASGTATLLATGSAAPVGDGWQRVELSAPLDLAIGSYRASVLMPAGQYSNTPGWWLGTGSGGTGPGAEGITNGILHGPNSTTVVGAGGQQTFTESAVLSRTEQAYGNGSYWIDIEVETSGSTIPVVVLTSVTADTGTDNGTATVTWDAVPGTDHYEAAIAPGLDQTTGFVVVDPTATSPYTFTALDGGDYTGAIRAYPTTP